MVSAGRAPQAKAMTAATVLAMQHLLTGVVVVAAAPVQSVAPQLFLVRPVLVVPVWQTRSQARQSPMRAVVVVASVPVAAQATLGLAVLVAVVRAVSTLVWQAPTG